MRYLHWALLALVSYTLVAPLLSVITREVPSDVAALVTNCVLVIAALGLVVYRDRSVLEYLDPGHPQAIPMYVAGVLLAVGILAYYRALSIGPVSIVVPIFGMFIVTSSLVGFAFLDESVTVRKVAGIGFAVLAVYLTSVE